jgi:two-component system sensor histidine kinase/response regulator
MDVLRPPDAANGGLPVLPRGNPWQGTVRTSRRSRPTSNEKNNSMNILIVDDQLVNLKLLQAQLEVEGHRIIIALDGIEALAVLEREKMDAIISDILMPHMDGYRLCYEVRRNPRLKEIPFIFYTATYTSPSDEKLCLDIGGDKYLKKPAPAEQIFAALREVVNIADRPMPKRARALSEIEVMKEYNERLVSKLEEKNIELQKTVQRLRLAHEEILDLNRNLERRVEERTVELEAANKELEAFSYSISHDLRAPLRVIDGFVRIVQEDFSAQLVDGARQKLEVVRENAIFMSQLIDGLLAFSQSSRRSLNKQPVLPSILVKRVLERLQIEERGRNIKISIGDLPECQADPVLLQQVFVNLLSNALKYTRRRDLAIIEVDWCDGESQGAYLVRDNGAGFDMKYAKNLFGIFQRFHSADQFEGVGVGLSIAQRIIQRHGGSIWAEAEVDKGATFYFNLSPG